MAQHVSSFICMHYDECFLCFSPAVIKTNVHFNAGYSKEQYEEVSYDTLRQHQIKGPLKKSEFCQILS